MAKSTAPTSLGRADRTEFFFQVAPPSVEREDSTPRVGRVDVAENRYINAIDVLRIDHDAAELAAVLKANMSPRFTGVDRFIHPTDTIGILTANVRLTGADVDHLGIRRSHSDCPDGADRIPVVGDRIPRAPGFSRSSRPRHPPEPM